MWQRVLRFDPTDPIWPNRDRFVLSEGHASALLWSLLHLTGVRAVDPDYEILGQPAVTLDDLKTFRQLDSKCPGHPEYRWTSGVETTTGPLGQGVATSVGMAIAGQWLGARYNREGFPIFDFDVYALAGDGCMMEGISSEAASFAAHQGLSNLCWIYDSNRVTIEGHTNIAFTEDVAARFMAYGWNVTTVADANDLDAIDARVPHVQGRDGTPDPDRRAQPHRLRLAGGGLAQGTRRAVRRRGRARPRSGSSACPRTRTSTSPTASTTTSRRASARRGARRATRGTTMFKEYRVEYPDLADELERMQRRELPAGWESALPTFPADAKGIASRDSSGRVLNAVAQAVPWVVGGSADLSPSTKTNLTFDGAGDFQARRAGADATSTSASASTRRLRSRTAWR